MSMREHLFHLDADGASSLQAQLREQIVSAILDGELPAGATMPSLRKLARSLGVSRNTVNATYQQLVAEGFLKSRERSGHYVLGDVSKTPEYRPPASLEPKCRPQWGQRLALTPSRQRNVVKAADWLAYPYPYIYNQLDLELFPVTEWRECTRLALAADALQHWVSDRIAEDDPLLVEQIRSRLLPRRGIHAAPDEVLVTVGAQHALYILARLLVTQRTTVGLEDPGYADMRNIFALNTANIVALPVDKHGLVPDERVNRCDYIYTTPSYQFPTTGTMPLERRRDLLERAGVAGCIVIEDDYECEVRYNNRPMPALKSLDHNGQVLYVSSLSKTLAPGLRVGYMVGPADLIREARALRRLMLRHPAANNQRTTALFLQRGHHEALLRRLTQVFRKRWSVMADALKRHLPDCRWQSKPGSSGFWIRCPEAIDTRVLERTAMRHGILIEPGDIYFLSETPPRNYMRLAFSSAATDRIEPGIRRLGRLMREFSQGRSRPISQPAQ
ncbi:MAG: PLP-dependent aminotransferase family protein [Methyloligellaceae bacterium]